MAVKWRVNASQWLRKLEWTNLRSVGRCVEAPGCGLIRAVGGFVVAKRDAFG